MNNYYFGLDLGQKRDHSAVALVEIEQPVITRFDYVTYLTNQVKLVPKFNVRYLERLPLGTSYPAVVSQVRDLTRKPEVRKRCTLVVDGTGVGAAVVDLLHEADLECDVIPVSITSGAAARRDGGWWFVPKRDLIGAVQVLMDQERLRFAEDSPEVSRVVEEFMSMQVKVGDSDVQFGAWRAGEHDDLALAVALACWRAKGNERTVGERSDGRLV